MNTINILSVEEGREYTAQEVCDIFNVKRTTVYTWCENSDIGFTKMPGERGGIRILGRDIIKFHNRFYVKDKHDE